MLKVEIVEPNRTHVDRLEANGFTHKPNLDHYENRRSVTDSGNLVEVWTKPDGKREITVLDFGDLPELEDE